MTKRRMAGAPATADDVRRIAGDLSAATVSEILKLDASLEDIEIAASYARGEGSIPDREGHPLTGKAAIIYDLLTAEEDETDRDR
jgi:hypothetical protein